MVVFEMYGLRKVILTLRGLFGIWLGEFMGENDDQHVNVQRTDNIPAICEKL